MAPVCIAAALPRFVPQRDRARPPGDGTGPVGRAVIDHDHQADFRQLSCGRHGRGDPIGLVASRDDYRDVAGPGRC
jgi:hypothetical protein